MSTMLTVRNFIAANGERFSQIYDTAGSAFPMFYPTAYTTRHLRLGITHATQLARLYPIKKLHEWAKLNTIDLEYRLASKSFLNQQEIASLVEYVITNHLLKPKKVISKGKRREYLDVAAKYLSWLSGELIKDRNDPVIKSQIANVEEEILAYRGKAGNKGGTNQRILDTFLTESARKSLTDFFDNPLADAVSLSQMGTAYRNATLLRTLYETGGRVGEILGLTLDDFQISSGGSPAKIRIKRNHDDPVDDRLKQPVAKTKGREVPITAELEQMLEVYLKDWRFEVDNVGFGDSDPLFVTHLRGGRQGRGLQATALYSCISNLKKKHQDLDELHPHLLRHDWNYRFSEEATARGLTEKQATAQREYLMGWRTGSASAALYNERHIREEAHKTALSMLNLTARPSSQKVKKSN